MAGDSITQAREALLRVLDELRPQDWFNIVAFGSTATPLFNAQTRADGESVAYARGFLKKLHANMGGTEIGKALEMAVRLRCPEQIQQDVLLITDGEVYEWEPIVSSALTLNHRFFTVGVGSAVSEAFVRTLAERSGGVCELVTPNEKMAERIHRHFKRIGTPRFRSSEVVWPGTPLRVFPEQMPIIYDGDTCNLFAWFATPPEEDLQLQVALADGTTQKLCARSQAIDAGGNQDLSRMVAALKLREITEVGVGQELALRYQLVSRWTNYLAVVVRDDGKAAETLPDLHKVEQMLAAGWGGMGSVRDSRSRVIMDSSMPNGAYDMPTFSRMLSAPHKNKLKESKAIYSRLAEPLQDDFLVGNEHHDAMSQFIELLDRALVAGAMPATIHLPLLPAEIELLLGQLVAEGYDEQTVVTVFLHHIAGSASGDKLSRQAKRVINKAYKELKVDQQEVKAIKHRLSIELGELDIIEDEFDVPTFLRKGKGIRAIP